MTVKQRDQHDKQIAPIRNLIHDRMRLVVETKKDIRTLAAAQKRTEESLKALIDTMRGGRNGHGKRRINIQ